jgi:tetratricopeptide (TPR) repeat protein
VLDELTRLRKVEPPTFKVAYAYTAIPARYALERRQWKEAAQLTLPAGELGEFLLSHFPWAKGHIHFARAIGAARSGDTASARKEIDELSAISQQLAQVKGDYDWSKQINIQKLIASAWLQYAEGNQDEALRLARSAADLDDATEKHPVTPGSILPAREQLGELLLEVKQPSAALQEFETSFHSTPNRFNGIYGAARAARLAGNQKSAKLYYSKLLQLARESNSDRPEIQEAKTFVAKRIP